MAQFILYGGFQYDRKRILHLLSLVEGSPPSTAPSTPPRSSSSSTTRSGSRSILKHTHQILPSPSKDDCSTNPSSFPNTSISNVSSNSLQAKKLRWDHNSSPLKNSFLESEDEHLEGYESAASSSSVISTPVRPPRLEGLQNNTIPAGKTLQPESNENLRKIVPQQKQFQNHFHFILGKNGVLVQVWVFGSKTDIDKFSELIRVDEYFVFWGYSVKLNKYTSNLTSTSECGMVIPSNKFERITVTKIYQKAEDLYSEEQEIFSSSFRQASPTVKHPRRERKREHSFQEKQCLVDSSQPKITDYICSSPPLILNYSTDSLNATSPEKS